MPYIGYVSMPFRTHHGVNFDRLYEQAILPAAVQQLSHDVVVFREDAQDEPPWAARHRSRLERWGRQMPGPDPRLREEIQRHIIMADFVIADISHNNPNVMLEVGFAQAVGKHLIYLTHTFEQTPGNLGDLGRLHIYDADVSRWHNLENNLRLRIGKIVTDVERDQASEKQRGGDIQYFETRQKAALDEKFAAAKQEIKILTTNLMTISANYVKGIVTAINEAKKNDRELHVTILTSHPSDPYSHRRAEQLTEDPEGFSNELEGSLKSVAAQLEGQPNCRILTYRDFPLQLWHLIDDTIYIGAPSLLRRARYNCVIAVPVDVPGIQETYLDHFKRLAERAEEYPPKRARRRSALRKRAHRPEKPGKAPKRRRHRKPGGPND